MRLPPLSQAGLFAYFFARGKLSGDPAFGSIVHLGWIARAAACWTSAAAKGLLASLLLAADHGCGSVESNCCPPRWTAREKRSEGG
jgi:hypothetical protein